MPPKVIIIITFIFLGINSLGPFSESFLPPSLRPSWCLGLNDSEKDSKRISAQVLTQLTAREAWKEKRYQSFSWCDHLQLRQLFSFSFPIHLSSCVILNNDERQTLLPKSSSLFYHVVQTIAFVGYLLGFQDFCQIICIELIKAISGSFSFPVFEESYKWCKKRISFGHFNFSYCCCRLFGHKWEK